MLVLTDVFIKFGKDRFTNFLINCHQVMSGSITTPFLGLRIPLIRKGGCQNALTIATDGKLFVLAFLLWSTV